MAVRKKGRRKVNYKGRQYVWYVQDKDRSIPKEGGFVEPVKERYLHIIDSKKQFIIHYRIPEPRDEFALLKIEGQAFPRQPGAKEIQMPRWKHDSKRYPTADFVRRLIHWCMESEGDEK
jgi:transposase InsO family protein